MHPQHGNNVPERGVCAKKRPPVETGGLKFREETSKKATDG